MARITGSTTINWSSVSLGQVDFAAHFRAFASRVHQLLAAFYSGNYDIVSPGSTLLVLDMRFGGRLSLSGSGLDGPAPVIRTIDFKNPANGSGEVLRAAGTVNGGTEVLTSATIGSLNFSETFNGTIQIPENFWGTGAYVGNLTSLVARVGSATVTFRGTFGLSGNLSGASMAGTVTGITVVSGGGTITMTGLSLSWDGIEAALAADTLATVEDLLVFVGNHMPGNDAITYTNRSGAGMTFVGGAGNDRITILGPHGDTLVGGDGDDVLDGGLGLDTIIGGGGNDRIIMLVTQGNTDTINAGPGIDTLVLTGTVSGDREVVVNLSSTTDQVVSIGGAVDGPTQINVEHLDASRIVGFVSATGSAGDNVLIGSRGNDTLDGGDGDDVLDGGRGQDAVLGGAGHDQITMLVTAGNVDTIDAGTGVDTLILVGAVPGNRRVVIDLSQVDQVVSIGGLLDVPVQSNFENLDASKLGGVVEVTGSAADNVLIGSRGHDVLIGGAGDDVLIGGPGNDTLIGGPGDDIYVIGSGRDVLMEEPGEGTDLVESSSTYALGPNVEQLTLTGSKAINGTGNELENVLIGNNAANILIGGAGDDRLIGNGGNDRLDGGLGDDAMEGGAGHDTYIVDSLGDTVTESLAGAAGGIDLVLSAVDFTLGPNVEHLTLTGTDHVNGTGNELNNILTGNSGNNVLAGGAGNDTLIGGAGDDTLDGGAGRDRLIGGAGDDTYVVDLVQAGEGVAATVRLEDTITEGRNQGTDQVILRGIVSDLMRATTLTLGANLERLDAGLTADTKLNLTGNALDNELIGNDADNLLIGLAGNDRLDGGVGNDVLIGGQGNDGLIGGAGNDTYVFGRGDGQDVIQDTDGAADKVLFGRGIAPVDVILSRQADDLRLALRRTSDQVTIRDWYAGAANQVETIETGTRHLLLHTQVESLLQAMAQFTSDTGLSWEAAATGAGTGGQQAQFQTILAAHWTSAGSEGA